MPTQDQVVQAGICLYDYVLHPAVRGEFNRVLAAAKASPDDADKILQDFFERRRYATTPDAFKQVFSDYAKNPITLSPQATRFAIDFGASSVLRLDWYDAAGTMAAAQPAGAAPDPLAPFGAALKRNGYSDVTPVQATLAITRLLTSGIGAWAGIYSQTTIVDQQGSSKAGPALTIDTSEDPVRVTLDRKHILGHKFDPDTNTLSWTKEGTGAFPNDSAANLELSQYNWASSFAGALENRDGSFSYRGSTDQSRAAGTDSVKALAATAQPEELSPSDWIAIASGIVGFASLVATAVGVHIARKAWGVAEKSPTENAVATQIDRLVTALQNLERSSKITPEDFAKLVSYAPVQDAITVAVALGQVQSGEISQQQLETRARLQRQLELEALEANRVANEQFDIDAERFGALFGE